MLVATVVGLLDAEVARRARRRGAPIIGFSGRSSIEWFISSEIAPLERFDGGAPASYVSTTRVSMLRG